MAVVTIRGIPINFPFEPYDLQKDYMERVLDCLQNEKNGVLESPTGTGKTLSLLCSSLAWLELKKAQLQVHRQTMLNEENQYLGSLKTELEKTVGKTSGRSFIGLPTIIYASRTHSQLSQAMQELKRTSYKHMKACVLGSRDQLCIHPEVNTQETATLRIQMCQLKVKTRSCHFYNRVETKKADPAISELSIVDIEDFIKLGNSHKFCPYYMTKELKQHADIIFMPYNYLLDPLARKALGVELSNNVVILDEAHNIERMCEDSASLQIKTSDIALAIEEITAVMKIISEDGPVDFDESPKDFSPEDLCILKQTFLNLEKEIDNIELKNSPEGTNFDGSFIFELLSKAGVSDNNYNRFMQVITDIIQYLAALNSGPFARRGNGLQVFEDLLRIVFIGTSKEFKEKVKKCYRVHIIEEEVKKKKPDNWLSKAVAKSGGRILSYWCFSPGFGMNMLMGQGLKCVILTSGTLAPLRPLISELELNIGVRLENPHIVKGNQICIKIVTAGPDSEVLNCNFQNRDNPKFLSSLGRSILNFSRIIPNGLLIFFPSYPIMYNCKQHWQETGIWGNINAQKAIYVEPRDKDTFKTAMDEYYSKVQDTNLKGAIFMGVCRGKISEGLDFADINGRAVIIIGLPFPPLKDPKVILKKRYLDICNARDKEYLKGDEWYSLEATRAVNQAIGRVIRHRNDFGAIILLDARFNNFKIRNQMSMWLRDHIKVVTNFGEVIRDLRIFFKNAQSALPTPQVKAKSSIAQSAEFEIPSCYTKGNFDFTTSSVGRFNSGAALNDAECSSHKRVTNDPLENPFKRSKIRLIPNSTNVKNSVAKDYIVTARKYLDSSSFTNLTKAMKVYKETENFDNLIDALNKIFVNKHNLRYLIQGLEPYLKEHHKEAFNNFWEKMR